MSATTITTRTRILTRMSPSSNGISNDAIAISKQHQHQTTATAGSEPTDSETELSLPEGNSVSLIDNDVSEEPSELELLRQHEQLLQEEECLPRNFADGDF